MWGGTGEEGSAAHLVALPSVGDTRNGRRGANAASTDALRLDARRTLVRRLPTGRPSPSMNEVAKLSSRPFYLRLLDSAFAEKADHKSALISADRLLIAL